MSRVVIVTGPPGAGKSTLARRLAAAAEGALAVHLHTDDFYAYIRKGYVEPWRPESHTQNVTVMNALAAAAAGYAAGGFEVLVDGIVGPWFLEPWLAAARRQDLDLRYVVLRPGEAETVARAIARTGHPMTDPAVVRFMWKQFTDLGDLESHALDTSEQTPEATVAAIQDLLARGALRLA